MRPWSIEEERFIIRNGNRGSEWCRKEMAKRFNTKRTKTAVEVHASRMGVSLHRYRANECPGCYREFTRLVPATGMCRECTAKENRERLRERKERIRRNDADSKADDVERIRREANALRKWCNTN